jgi:SAM-dependent methyltransferase
MLLNRMAFGAPRGEHLTRYQMYRTLRRELACEPESHQVGLRALSISRSVDLARLVSPHAIITEADYPEHDLLALDFPDDSFDLVVSDQVLEHVAGDPAQAMRESVRVVRPGGLVVHTTCLINPIHDSQDFWRFTPDALALLAEQTAEVVMAGGWGNRYAVVLTMMGLRHEPIPHRSHHPLHKVATYNDQRNLIVTWVAARKPV